MHSDTPPLMDLRVSAVAREYRKYCCKAAYQSNYLLYLEGDMSTAVANAACLWVRLGAVHQMYADVVESLNAIVKWAYNYHRAQGGGGWMPGATSVEW